MRFFRTLPVESTGACNMTKEESAVQTSFSSMNSRNEPLMSCSVDRRDLINLSPWCPQRPYTQLEIPPNCKEVRTLQFDIVSHDQGTDIKLRHATTPNILYRLVRYRRGGSAIRSVVHLVHSACTANRRPERSAS